MFVLPVGDAANEILPGLWLGNGKAALDRNFLIKNSITTVFNCTKDILFSDTIRRQYRVPVDDNLQMAEIRNLELWSFEIIAKLAKEINAGHKTLVHCAAGMQRSAAVMAMYLIATQKMTTDEAMAYIRSKRPIAFMPMANFEKAIRGFETTLLSKI
jgi:protein tyrosine/serine phosphatase